MQSWVSYPGVTVRAGADKCSLGVGRGVVHDDGTKGGEGAGVGEGEGVGLVDPVFAGGKGDGVIVVRVWEGGW